MPFGTFALISLFYVFIGIRVLRDLWVRRREAFDLQFTESDRYLVDQASFFLLVPISVALHELGHAVAIWLYGGKVIDFNYYVFAGSVSYNEPFTDAQHIVVAAAGTIVNLILCALALLVVFFWRPPFRAAINELFFQFAVISGLNALIVYPLLDFAAGMNGDWSQMYDGGVPSLSLAIFIIHAGILVASYLVWKNPRFRQRLAVVTGMPSGTERGLMGGLRRGKQQQRSRPASPEEMERFAPASPAEDRFRKAADRVSRGWHQPVQGRIDRRDEGSQVALVWISDGTQRAVAMRYEASGRVIISGAAASVGGQNAGTPIRQELRSWPELPDENDLTMALRMSMEVVESWHLGVQSNPVAL